MKCLITLLFFIFYVTAVKPEQFNEVSLDTGLETRCITRDIFAIVTIKNQLKDEVFLNRNEVRTDGLTFRDLFEVVETMSGNVVKYNGMIAEFNYDKSQYFSLKSGEKIELMFNVSKLYQLSVIKKYTIKFRSSSYDKENDTYYLFNSNEVVSGCGSELSGHQKKNSQAIFTDIYKTVRIKS